MLTIHLKDIDCFAFHGVHPEERITGNHFLVNMDVECLTPGDIHELVETVDYSIVYEIIHRRMKEPRPLLEEVAQTISRDVAALSHIVKKTSITILKKNPPIAGFEGRVGITLQKDW
jgi:dihydroneopterin aldolase